MESAADIMQLDCMYVEGIFGIVYLLEKAGEGDYINYQLSFKKKKIPFHFKL